jgi:sugar phosphate isomerase/epimerase
MAMQPRFLGLAHLTALELSPPELVRAAHAAGFHGVGLRLNPGFADDPQPPMLRIDEQARLTKALLEDTGLQVLDIEILRLKAQMDFDLVRAMFEVGAWLGARHVLVLGNDPDEARSTDHFGQVCELAAGYGLSPALEFVFFNDVRTLGQAMRIVHAVNQPNARILVDSLHFFRAGHQPADLQACPPSLLGYAQWCDAGPDVPPLDKLQNESRTNRRFPGEGVLPLADLLVHLPADIPLTLEAPNANLARAMPGPERIARGMQALRRTLDAADAPGALR